MRILYHHRIAAADGMRVHVTELVEALRADGHDVFVVGPGSDQAPKAGDSGAALELLADRLRGMLPPMAFELLELLYNIPAYLRLSKAARAFKPDLIYERYNLFLLAGLAYRWRHRLPMALEVNSPLAAERSEFGNLQFKGLGRRCEAALWRGADAVLPVSHVLAEQVHRVRNAPSGVHVIPNGANLERRPEPNQAAATRRQLQLGEDTLVLGFVGFIRAWHGVGWAIEALAGLPKHVHLVVVGDGPARGQLEQRAQALGVISRVRFAGRRPHDEVPAYMQCFDIALQTAAVSYASPLKLFEYMGLARAIIAPDQPNIREVLADGENALLFQPDSAESFQAALSRLCGDATLRERLGANALRTIEQTPLTWSHNAVRIATIGQALMNT